MGRKLTHEEFCEKVKNRFPNDRLTPLDKYKNKRSPILMRHEECGRTFERDGGNWMYTAITACPYCYDRSYKPPEEIMKEVNMINPYIIFISERSEDRSRLFKLHCSKCDYIFENSVYNINRSINRSGHACQKCAGVYKMTTEEMNNKLLEESEGEYSLAGDYINYRTPVKVKHVCCGKITKKHPSLIFKGKICNHCYSERDTFAERVISDFLKKRNVSFQSEYWFENLKGAGGRHLRFDFCLLLKNKIVLIEYDGAYHFDEDLKWLRQSNVAEHDKRKNDFCQKQNIKLYRIHYTVETQAEIEEEISRILLIESTQE